MNTRPLSAKPSKPRRKQMPIGEQKPTRSLQRFAAVLLIPTLALAGCASNSPPTVVRPCPTPPRALETEIDLPAWRSAAESYFDELTALLSGAESNSTPPGQNTPPRASK